MEQFPTRLPQQGGFIGSMVLGSLSELDSGWTLLPVPAILLEVCFVGARSWAAGLYRTNFQGSAPGGYRSYRWDYWVRFQGIISETGAAPIQCYGAQIRRKVSGL